MGTYVTLGKYTTEGVKGISAERTGKVRALLEKHGGKLKAGYALLGVHDLVLVLEFPSNEHAIKASVALSKLTGISFATSPAVTVEEFDRLIEET